MPLWSLMDSGYKVHLTAIHGKKKNRFDISLYWKSSLCPLVSTALCPRRCKELCPWRSRPLSSEEALPMGSSNNTWKGKLGWGIFSSCFLPAQLQWAGYSFTKGYCSSQGGLYYMTPYWVLEGTLFPCSIWLRSCNSPAAASPWVLHHWLSSSLTL